MKSICYYVNRLKPNGNAVREQLAAEASKQGMTETTDGLSADVVVVLGGDGTILRAVHEFPGVPILGLNLGGLGYLSTVGEHDFSAAIAMLATGRYRISERTMLRVVGHEVTALNDIVIMREMSGHAAVLDLEVNGRIATRYLADGLVFATPTGSTAYSLSAGGPVLMPDSGSFVVTPMSPHALGIRPLVVSDRSEFSVTPRERTLGNSGRIGVYADGEAVMMLDAGESVSISKDDRVARLVELEGYDPYEVLSRKLGWNGRGNAGDGF